MSRHLNDIEKVLKRSLPSASKEQLESAQERILSHVLSDRDAESFPVVTKAAWTSIPAVGAVAAVLVVMISATLLWRSDSALGTVLSADGSLTLVHGGRPRAVSTDQALRAGDSLQTAESRSTLALTDGSRVEIRARSELTLEHADDGTRIHLAKGGVIVNAAKQSSGRRLYVQTKDMTVSVIGTVFFVNAEMEGSRVAVIEGEVRVRRAGDETSLLPGQQLSTNPEMKPVPMRQELSWSQEARAHVALLEQATAPATGGSGRLRFEVASIKRIPALGQGARSSLGGDSPECLGVDGRIEAGRLLDAGQGRCIGDHVSLLGLIAAAYDLNDTLAARRVSGGPDWLTDVWNHGFQINAKAPNPATATKADLRQMLQSMLQERFKLRVSFDTRDVEGFVLAPAKGGLRLEAAPAAPEQPLRQQVISGNDGLERLTTGKGTFNEFVAYLSKLPPMVFGPVANKVEAPGSFMFNLSYVVPQGVPGAGGQRSGGLFDGGLENRPAYTSLRNALRNQLGVELSTGKVPEQFIIVEHAEEPSEN